MRRYHRWRGSARPPVSAEHLDLVGSPISCWSLCWERRGREARGWTGGGSGGDRHRVSGGRGHHPSRGQIAGLTTPRSSGWSPPSDCSSARATALALVGTTLIFLTLTVLGMVERKLLNAKNEPPNNHH